MNVGGANIYIYFMDNLYVINTWIVAFTIRFPTNYLNYFFRPKTR